jgi:hypothetical protein
MVGYYLSLVLPSVSHQKRINVDRLKMVLNSRDSHKHKQWKGALTFTDLLAYHSFIPLPCPNTIQFALFIVSCD